MCSCFRFFQKAASGCMLLSIGALLFCGSIEYWWSTKSSDVGLWKTCSDFMVSSRLCLRRGDLLEFKSKELKVAGMKLEIGGRKLDIVFVSLLVAVVTAIIHLILLVRSMCQRHPSKSIILVGTVFLSFGVAASIFGTIWALVMISKDNLGWAFYVLYGVDGMLLLGLMCSIITLCSRTPDVYITTSRDDEVAMLKR